MSPWIVLLVVSLSALLKCAAELAEAIRDHRSPPPLDYLYPDRAKWEAQVRRRAIAAWSIGVALELIVAVVAAWQLWAAS